MGFNSAFKGLNTLQFVHKMSVNIIEFVVAVQNCFLRCGVCGMIEFYNGLFQEEVKLRFCRQHDRKTCMLFGF